IASWLLALLRPHPFAFSGRKQSLSLGDSRLLPRIGPAYRRTGGADSFRCAIAGGQRSRGPAHAGGNRGERVAGEAGLLGAQGISQRAHAAASAENRLV